MSKERDFHKLIENQDKEEKEALWQKIESRLEQAESDDIESAGEVLVCSKNRANNTSRSIIIIVSVFLALALAVCLIYFLTKKPASPDGTVDDPKEEITEPDNKRYCTFNDYHKKDADITIKQYAVEKNKELLYFDYYDDTEFYADSHYVLTETDEVICLFEEMYDINFSLINLYITDDKTEMDILNSISDTCNSETTINTVKVNYFCNDLISNAKFDYKGHSYYLSVQDAPEEGYILTLVEELLS